MEKAHSNKYVSAFPGSSCIIWHVGTEWNSFLIPEDFWRHLSLVEPTGTVAVGV